MRIFDLATLWFSFRPPISATRPAHSFWHNWQRLDEEEEGIKWRRTYSLIASSFPPKSTHGVFIYYHNHNTCHFFHSHGDFANDIFIWFDCTWSGCSLCSRDSPWSENVTRGEALYPRSSYPHVMSRDLLLSCACDSCKQELSRACPSVLHCPMSQGDVLF